MFSASRLFPKQFFVFSAICATCSLKNGEIRVTGSGSQQAAPAVISLSATKDTMLKITLKKNEDRRIKAGHPWVFSNEIAAMEGAREPGIAAELFDAGDSFIGRGYYTPHSLIAFRLLTRQREDVDSAEFHEQRISAALAHRRSVYPALQTFRAVYGESDFLPGLVVDKYGDYLSLQILSGGMERRRDLIVEA